MTWTNMTMATLLILSTATCAVQLPTALDREIAHQQSVVDSYLSPTDRQFLTRYDAMNPEDAYKLLVATGKPINDGDGKWMWDGKVLAYKDKFDHIRYFKFKKPRG